MSEDAGWPDLEDAARRLQAEADDLEHSHVRFVIRAKGRRSFPLIGTPSQGIELLAWPEGGMDNFFEPVRRRNGLFGGWRSVQRCEVAAEAIRGIVQRYATGERAPFG